MKKLTLSKTYDYIGILEHDTEELLNFEPMDGFENWNANKIVKYSNYLRNNYYKIKNIHFSGEDIIFNVDDMQIVLKDKEKFYEDEYFSFIKGVVKSKKYKLTRKNSFSMAIVGTIIVATIASASVASANSTTKDIEPVSNAPIIYEDEDYDNSMEEFTTVNQEYTTEENNQNEDVTETEPVVETPTVLSNEVESDNNTSYDISNLASENKTDSEKAQKTIDLYYDLIEKNANICGVDPNLICAIATQERGVHCTEVDSGGAIGLMQIQVEVWDGHDIKFYNHETDQYETLHITLDKLRDADFNILTGCAIFQGYLKQMDYNVPLAVQTYNMGPGSVNSILNRYAENSNKTVEEIKRTSDDFGWRNYRDGYAGDPQYVEHVSRYYNSQNKLETSARRY